VTVKSGSRPALHNDCFQFRKRRSCTRCNCELTELAFLVVLIVVHVSRRFPTESPTRRCLGDDAKLPLLRWMQNSDHCPRDKGRHRKKTGLLNIERNRFGSKIETSIDPSRVASSHSRQTVKLIVFSPPLCSMDPAIVRLRLTTNNLCRNREAAAPPESAYNDSPARTHVTG